MAGRTDRVFLTGLTDERGVRIGSYGYDAKGRATVTEDAGGVRRHEISYAALDAAGRTYVDTNPVSIAITYPNGSTLTRDYRQIGPYSRVIGSSQPGGAGCGAASQSIGYDAQGNVASETGFSGGLTCFQHDAVRNLRAARGEGFAAGAACPADLAAWTPAAGTLERKISTQWHPDHRLPTRESHPKRITTWVYNGQPDPTAGNAIASCAPVDALVDGKPIAVLCKQVEQATTDETGGAGFAATSSGAPRIWTYTYDKAGRRLASNGPRTDVNDIVTLAYYTDTTADHTRGDLMSITDETGLVTQYTKYNRRGQPLEMIAPNGTVTGFTYFPRGWLQNHSVQAGGVVESTAYAYDAAGHLTQVTLPDTSTLTYTYDDAGRLTRVADNAGNRIDYSFDAMGNVVGEESKDALGNLARRVSRVYDQLNRVQQVMGDMQ